MSDNSPDSVLGSLPHSRPHRRSEKRAAPAKQAQASRPSPPAPEAAAPAIERDQASSGCHSLPTGTELAGTVVKAAVELTEIALSLSARALRIAISRLPRP